MELAVVTPFPPRLTGIGQYGYHLCRALARSGMFDRVAVIAEEDGQPGIRAANGLEEWRCWRPGDPLVGIRLLAGLRRAKPDVVWVNFGLSMFGPSPVALLSGLLGLSGAALGGVPLALTLHEPGILGEFRAEELGVWPGCRLVLRLIAGWLVRLGTVVVPLRSGADRLHRKFPGSRVVYIPHGTFDPPELLPEPPEPGVLFFGFLAPYKGLPTLGAAFRRVRAENPGVTLEVAGAEHPRFPGYARTVRQALAGVPGVRWSGPVPEAEVRGVFVRNTVVVLPYRVALGASSLLYRAAAWGRPVVASDLPPLRAAAAEAGLQVNWVAPDDEDGLTEALGVVLSRPELREAQRRQNLRAAGALTLEAVTHAYGRLLNNVGRRPASSPVPEWQ